MTNEAKYTKGQKANYYGNEATILKAEFNVFTNDFDYSIKYSEEGIRKGQTGVKAYELK